jgi:hypothetical protein
MFEAGGRQRPRFSRRQHIDRFRPHEGEGQPARIRTPCSGAEVTP